VASWMFVKLGTKLTGKHDPQKRNQVSSPLAHTRSPRTWLGGVMAHVVVRVGDNLIESAITRRSADDLKLKKGDTVVAVVKPQR
jgi:molybdopterin-binding protein